MRKRKVSGATLAYGTTSVIILIICPPLGLLLCLGLFPLFCSDRRRSQAPVKVKSREQREREMIIVYKSLP